jgi:hypothetical protein
MNSFLMIQMVGIIGEKISEASIHKRNQVRNQYKKKYCIKVKLHDKWKSAWLISKGNYWVLHKKT